MDFGIPRSHLPGVQPCRYAKSSERLLLLIRPRLCGLSSEAPLPFSPALARLAKMLLRTQGAIPASALVWVERHRPVAANNDYAPARQIAGQELHLGAHLSLDPESIESRFEEIVPLFSGRYESARGDRMRSADGSTAIHSGSTATARTGGAAKGFESTMPCPWNLTRGF